MRKQGKVKERNEKRDPTQHNTFHSLLEQLSVLLSPCKRWPARPKTNLPQHNSWSPLLVGASESGLVGESKGEGAKGRKKLVMLWEQNQ